MKPVISKKYKHDRLTDAALNKNYQNKRWGMDSTIDNYSHLYIHEIQHFFYEKKDIQAHPEHF